MTITMSSAHSPTFPSLHLHHKIHSRTLPSLYLCHSSFSNPSVASPRSQFILQPYFCFSYVTISSLNSPGEPPMQLQLMAWERSTCTLYLFNKSLQVCRVLWLFEIRGHTLWSKLYAAKIPHKSSVLWVKFCGDFKIDRSTVSHWTNRSRGGCVSIDKA